MRRAAGWTLFASGLLAAALLTVERATSVHWYRYDIALLALLIGAFLLRRTAEHPAGVLIINIQAIRSSLTMLSAKLRKLDTKKRADLGVFGIHGFIDAHLLADLDRFLAARETLIHRHGLMRYGRIMDAFAAGERALFRAWSASVDGYVDEVDACLDRAYERFAHALSLVEEAEKQ